MYMNLEPFGRLLLLPVRRLSTTITSCPNSRSLLTTFEPINPAPPVTRYVSTIFFPHSLNIIAKK